MKNRILNLITLNKEEKLEYLGEGEWVEEPNSIVFNAYGNDCVVIRVLAKEISGDYFGGHLCGYVKLPEDHIWNNEKECDIDCDVHGGITFSENLSEGRWIGFDCGHSGDLIPSRVQIRKKYPISEIFPIPEEFKKYSIFNPVYRNMEYCMQECRSLSKQINENYANLMQKNHDN